LIPLARAQDVTVVNDVEPASLVPADQSANPPLPAPSDYTSINPTTDASTLGVPRKYHFSLELSVRAVYDDNVNITAVDHKADMYVSIQPVLILGVGDIMDRQENYLRLDYAPSVFLFIDHSDLNAFEHLVHIQGQYLFTRLKLNLTQDVQILDGANLDAATTAGPVNNRINLDVSARTRVDIYSTRLSASYDFTGKIFASSELSASISDYHSLISSQVFSGNLFLNYAYSQKLTVGVGGSAGFDEVDDPNPGQKFEQINGRLSYQLTGKISLNASGGVEFRQFGGGSDRSQNVSPVFDIGASYQPFDGTTLALSASRRTLNSASLAAQDFTNTSLTITARQRLFRKVTFGIATGLENADYFSTLTGVDSTRTDNYYFVEPSLDVAVTRFWSVGVYYLYRKSDSSIESFSFYDNQFGIRTSLKF
jgi:hypothetical protein